MSVQVESEKIQVEVSEEQPPPSGCFIAAACYGSPTHLRVCQLRRIKDALVDRSKIAQRAYRLYYVFSPAVAMKIKHKEKAKKTIRTIIELAMKLIKL